MFHTARSPVRSLLLLATVTFVLPGLIGCGDSKPKMPTAPSTSQFDASKPPPTAPRGPVAATVTPTFEPGNPSCQSLGYPFEAKIDPAEPGTTVYPVAGLGSITLVVDSNDHYFDWTSTFGIDAVIAKGGPNANVYTYDPPAESFGDTGLSAPLNNGTPYGISHVSFCYDINLVVTKTALPTFTRDYDWTIVKTASPTTLALGGSNPSSGSIDYQIIVTKDAGTDSGWSVSGTIDVTNPHPDVTALNVVVTDEITGHGAVAVSCPSTSIAPGATMQCTYGPVALPNGDSRTNTASATASNLDGGTGSAPVNFTTPTTVQDDCVDISDSYSGAPGLPTNICASQTFNYSRTFNAADLDCDENIVTNVATLANDDGSPETDDASVTITVECTPEEGCTPGYWKNHLSAWALTGYTPGQTVGSVFSNASPYDATSLLDALNLPGGRGVDGAKGTLLRAAVAALLNAAHPDVDYPESVADIISAVNAALASGNRDTMLALATELDLANNAGCPL